MISVKQGLFKKRRNKNFRAKNIALSEIRKENKATKIELALFIIALLSTSSLVILFTSSYLSTGYVTYVASEAGYITELTVSRKFPSSYWNGVYGLGLRVPGFTQQLSDDWNNEIRRMDVFFDCVETDAVGGNEIYATNDTVIDFDSLVPANLTELDSYVGCGTARECPSSTFTNTSWIMVGATNITNVPFTTTYRYDGNNSIFGIGALKDGFGNFVFVTHIGDVQKGFSTNYTVNYQMLIPSPASTTQTYYFFTDPNDVCPAGGSIGSLIASTVFGYVTDSLGSPVENATVNLAGLEYPTDSNGFYNISLDISGGTYNVVTSKTNYDTTTSNVTINDTAFDVEHNITLSNETPGSLEPIIVTISGYITDNSSNPLYLATVDVGGESTTTNILGYYSIVATLLPKNHTLVASKNAYNNNFSVINLTLSPSSVSVDLTLTEVSVAVEELLFPTGPFTKGPYTEEPISQIIQEAEETGEDNWISAKEINKEVRKNTFIDDYIGIYNFGSTKSLTFILSPELEGLVTLDKNALTIEKDSVGEVKLTIYGIAPVGVYKGNITISGSLDVNIPVTIKIVDRKLPIETLLMSADMFKPVLNKGDFLKYRVTLQNLLSDQGYAIKFQTKVISENGSATYATKEFNNEISSSLTLLEEIKLPEDIPNGKYMLSVEAIYLNYITKVLVPFTVAEPIYLYSFFGIPLWAYLVFISFLSFILLGFFIYKRQLDKKKRYRVAVDYKTLPVAGDRVARLGHVAETNKDAFLELDKLTTHCVVAGATGMGKSISAQVIIEEALIQNIAVIVFDPTAQWSGMLRKLEDKKMLSFYPKFNMKPKDARGFPGNIRAVKDARQIIDVSKTSTPGHIQIFTLNKLQPKDMDIFVANVIRGIFKSDPKESPDLKTLLVFDEVHRLLPKFGGSGEGFLQIERGCREFRKWGLGQLLISQVMNDFVGEIKANINTEVQTRTVEEGDLERIKTKYGDGFLKSLVKSEVGVAMFQNAEYNRGLPYFINFRPILHNTRRLSDEELDKYNQYNDQVEDLEFQTEELEKEKIDVFDLKMELKLVKDKIMVGNFSVVDIYLEGLKPRMAKQWEKLGKKAPERKIELADLDEIKKSVEEAKKESEKAKAKEASSKKAVEEVKEDLNEKLLDPLTFDNGMMVSSVKELKDSFSSIDEDVLKIHVNETKNDVAAWFEKINPAFALKLKGIKDKATMQKEIESFDANKVTKAAVAAKPAPALEGQTKQPTKSI